MSDLTRWALVHDGAIHALADTDFGAPDPGWRDMTGAAGDILVGAILVDGVWQSFSPPPLPPPITVTNFQLRAALMAMPAPGGTMFDLVDAAVHAEGGVALQAWEYANDVDRTGPLVQQMAAAFGFDEAQLDALFTTAAGISA